MTDRSEGEQSSEMANSDMLSREDDFYAWIALTAAITTFFHILLLGITVGYIRANLIPFVDEEDDKRNNGIKITFKKLKSSICKLSSPPSPTVLTTSDSSPPCTQPSDQLEENNPSPKQHSSTSDSKAVGRDNSPMPAIQSMGLPPVPCSEYLHPRERNHSVSSESDHEYDYIKLPVNMLSGELKTTKPKEEEVGETNNSTPQSDQSEPVYDTFVHLPKHSE